LQDGGFLAYREAFEEVFLVFRQELFTFFKVQSVVSALGNPQDLLVQAFRFDRVD